MKTYIQKLDLPGFDAGMEWKEVDRNDDYIFLTPAEGTKFNGLFPLYTFPQFFEEKKEATISEEANAALHAWIMIKRRSTNHDRDGYCISQVELQDKIDSMVETEARPLQIREMVKKPNLKCDSVPSQRGGAGGIPDSERITYGVSCNCKPAMGHNGCCYQTK